MDVVNDYKVLQPPKLIFPSMNIYINLTNKFNEGRLRAVLSSGQAVVLHRLAIMSKDGDWIVREDDDSLAYILGVLDSHGARYRFGAPLDARWLAGGWSSHFEFMEGNMRIRTDFVSRPPRIAPVRLKEIWKEQEKKEFPFIGLSDLAEIKKTNREKDYAVIGELARRIDSLELRLRYSRSARDILAACENDPTPVYRIFKERGIGKEAFETLETLESALDAERRQLMHANERRLGLYTSAARSWVKIWKEVEKQTKDVSLQDAHAVIRNKASGILPEAPEREVIHE